MEYKGIKLTEANGKGYPLQPNPKDMLVWDHKGDTPGVRGVLGYFKGDWVAADINGKGIVRWAHAAEVPKRPTLAEYLKDIKAKTGYYPYVVQPNDRERSEEERHWGIGVSEKALLDFSHEIKEAKYTFVVLPTCSDTVKDMFHNYMSHQSRANIVFPTEEEVR